MRNQKGFTISELLVAMTIGGIVMVTAYSMYMSQTRSSKITEEVSGLQQNLRAAMYHIERELRMAGYNPTRSTSGAFRFTIISSSNSVTFTMDNSENGALDPGETITYFFRATDNTLIRNAGTNQVVADNISNLSFAYLNASGTATTDGATVRSVDVTLTASGDGHTRQLVTRVRCRNMGL
ncbi:PilW family protein [Thermodesulfobacteriota bacterium]